ncbi:hypothetical protein ILT44_21060 [Microvirga sp. BT689]|uniref:hypothetical protein n=1 Tax=Microvirga arvi TaxID=2778731 RepID=UPI00194E90A5|nr:hypothetical protein [Microvirga arvi]MBM6582698.1 hypothetical protein [Microvirga arvi]
MHFRDQNKFTRWAIQDSWKGVGQQTFQKVTQLVADQIAEGVARKGISHDELITGYLQYLVVDAAAEMNLRTIPCRSYALMQHLGSPYYLIETDGLSPISVRSLEVNSWQEADQMIDDMDAEHGNSYVRVRNQADHISIILPDDPAHSAIAPGTLTGLLQPYEKLLQGGLRPKPEKGLRPYYGAARPKMWHKR